MTSPASADTQSSSPAQERLGIGVFILLTLLAIAIALSISEPRNHKATSSMQASGLELPGKDILDLVSLESDRPLSNVEAKLRRGSTLQQALITAGADRGDAHAAMKSVFDTGALDPKRLQIGTTVQAFLSSDTPRGKRIVALRLQPEPGRQIFVKRAGNGFLTSLLEPKLTPSFQRVSGEIEYSLYQTALSLGSNDMHIAGFASAFAYDVDFQREIHPGDQFEMMFPVWTDERGRHVRTGEIIYAALDGKRKTKTYYWHTPTDDGISGWYDQNGESATRFLMKTPINGARLSSSFGRRRHPISGYSRMHKGTDFAAPTGTPVYAAGHGVIERSSRYGGYGKYVRIRHANGYKTAYAHLSRYGPRVKKGRRVRQGDIIGYVGSTGASTGPHLHYEVIVNGRHVNAMSLNLPTGRKLANTEGMLDEFLARKQMIDRTRNRLGARIEVAATGLATQTN